MTDWWGDSAAWASAAGTISATITALYIASRGWREASAERDDRDAAQARRVVVDGNGEGSFKIINLSDAPVLEVSVLMATRLEYGWQFKELVDTRLREDKSGMRAVLRPEESLTVDVMSEDHSNIALTIRFTDAHGLDWKRTSNHAPCRLVDHQARRRHSFVPLGRKKR